MKKVLIFAGTTEGRLLAQQLSRAGAVCDVQVATEYGQLVMPELPGVTVSVGRLSAEDMRARCSGYAAVVDATHPFAVEVSQNIRKAVGAVPYLRLLRRTESGAEGGNVRYYTDCASCAAALAAADGAVLLTTGSKELAEFCGNEALRERLYVRVLPNRDSLSLCEQAGVSAGRILAMQGPFSAELNLALIRQYGIRWLVTKESGAHSGFSEKLAAAAEAGIGVCVIGRQAESGLSFSGVTARLSALLGCTVPDRPQVEIALIGVGMSAATLTADAGAALGKATLVFGAKRLLEACKSLCGGKETYPFYRAEDILPVLREKERESGSGILRIAVLFSGDTGFYSGAEKIKSQFKKNNYDEIHIYPGISSVSYLSAATDVSWQDAKIVSIHGETDEARAKSLVGDAVRHEKKTFLLVSGAADVRRLGAWLEEWDLPKTRMIAGFQLSYDEEEIRELSHEAAKNTTKEGLYTLLLLTEEPVPRLLSSEIEDECFKRSGEGGKQVPMTKQEVRTIALGKLHLTPNAVVYDVGAGTGSVAIACALQSPHIRVYAIEQRQEAQVLLRENITRFNISNVFPVDGTAPEILGVLPQATHVFIGGSGGRLRDILRAVWEKNPGARVVAMAVSVETLTQLSSVAEDGAFSALAAERTLSIELVQVQISRAQAAGAHRLLRAQNPVWICTLVWEL